jgi:hypothetical protein
VFNPSHSSRGEGSANHRGTKLTLAGVAMTVLGSENVLPFMRSVAPFYGLPKLEVAVGVRCILYRRNYLHEIGLIKLENMV